MGFGYHAVIHSLHQADDRYEIAERLLRKLITIKADDREEVSLCMAILLIELDRPLEASSMLHDLQGSVWGPVARVHLNLLEEMQVLSGRAQEDLSSAVSAILRCSEVCERCTIFRAIPPLADSLYRVSRLMIHVPNAGLLLAQQLGAFLERARRATTFLGQEAPTAYARIEALLLRLRGAP